MTQPARQPAVAPARVLAFAGSLRTRSLNLRLLHAAIELAPAALEIEIDRGLQDIPPFNEDIEAAALAAGPVHGFVERVDAADALLIATPEYNQSLPGVLKNAIDWLSRPRDGGLLTGKPVAIIGATPGRWGTRLAQAALRQTLFALEAPVVTGPALYLAGAVTAFDADGNLTSADARASLAAVMSGLADLLRPARVRNG